MGGSCAVVAFQAHSVLTACSLHSCARLVSYPTNGQLPVTHLKGICLAPAEGSLLRRPLLQQKLPRLLPFLSAMQLQQDLGIGSCTLQVHR